MYSITLLVWMILDVYMILYGVDPCYFSEPFARNQRRPKVHGLWFLCTTQICQRHSCTMCRVHPSKPIPNLPNHAKSHAHSASHSHRLEIFQFEIDSLLGFWFAFNCKLIHCTHTHTLPHYCNITVYSQPWNQSIKSIKPAACILLAWRMSREIAVPSPKTAATLPVELEAAYDAGCSWQVVFSCQTAL